MASPSTLHGLTWFSEPSFPGGPSRGRHLHGVIRHHPGQQPVVSALGSIPLIQHALPWLDRCCGQIGQLRTKPWRFSTVSNDTQQAGNQVAISFKVYMVSTLPRGCIHPYATSGLAHRTQGSAATYTWACNARIQTWCVICDV